jgi:hypothetical protein
VEGLDLGLQVLDRTGFDGIAYPWRATALKLRDQDLLCDPGRAA